MGSRQRTFELIPTSLVVSNGPKPPMTSKQAKKAHQLATRGPKISKAEQRRQAAEELAAQKREFDREKASARAKVVREKKAAREQLEREERKKLGVPEPSKFVRASQPTISRFVKKGNKRTWILETVEDAEESDTSTVRDDQCDSIREHPTKKVKGEGESEDEYGGFPSFSQSDLRLVLEDFDSPRPSESEQNDRAAQDAPLRNLPQSGARGDSVGRPRLFEVAPGKTSSDQSSWDCLEDMDDMVTVQLLSETAAAVRSSQQAENTNADRISVLVPPKSVTITKPSSLITQSSPSRAHAENGFVPEQICITGTLVSGSESPITNAKIVPRERAALQVVSVNMLPPALPIPNKDYKAISFASILSKPHMLPQFPPRYISKTVSPPSATQVFLEDHLEDFFPSPSQEVRELFNDVDDLPANAQILCEREQDLPMTKSPKLDSFDDLICTQDLILSSQDILEITTPCPASSKTKRSAQLIKATSMPITRPAARQSKRRFFEEKEEDLLYAAIQESKALAVEQGKRDLERRFATCSKESNLIAPKRNGRLADRDVTGRGMRTLQRTVSIATDYGEEEFHDCEEELLALC